MGQKNGLIIFPVFALLIFTASACEDSDITSDEKNLSTFEAMIQEGTVTGTLNPFALVENPDYTPAHQIDFIREDQLVLVSKACGLVLAYPHNFMSVEVVNEYLHGVAVAITYCPITRSGIQWNRINGKDTLLLTASGYLLKDNLVPYDLHTESLWSQMLLSGIHGKHENQTAETLPLVETTWKTLVEHFPEAGVFINSNPLKSEARSLLPQVYGIIDREEVLAFRMEDLEPGISLRKIKLRSGENVILAGSGDLHFMVSYICDYNMVAVEDAFPVIMKDETGSLWTVFGEAVSGERGGEQLESPTAYSAADWAWKELFETVNYPPRER